MFDWVTGAIWTGWAFIKRFILPWSSDLPGVSRFYSASDATQFHDGVVLLNYLKDHSTSIQGFGQLCGEITSKLSEIVKSTVTIDNAAEMLQMVEDSASMLGKVIKYRLFFVSFDADEVSVLYYQLFVRFGRHCHVCLRYCGVYRHFIIIARLFRNGAYNVMDT